MKQRRLAIIGTEKLPVPPAKGGAVETLVGYLLKENENEGLLEIDVYSVDDEMARQLARQYKNCRFHFFPLSQVNNAPSWIQRLLRRALGIRLDGYSYVRQVRSELSKHEYDWILLENRPQFAPALARAASCPIVLHLHNDTLSDQIRGSRRAALACDAIFTVSDYIAGRVQTLKLRGNPLVATWKNCVDYSAFARSVEEDDRLTRRQSWGIGGDDIVVVFAGRLEPQKGVEELMEACVLSQSRLRLVLVGSPWFGQDDETEFTLRLRSLASRLGDRVVLTGYVDHEEMPGVYAAADIAAVPSVWDDPAPLVVMEAMASGLPLIVTDSGGIPEYCESCYAIEVPRGPHLAHSLAEAIDRLCADEPTRKRMGAHARARAAEIGPEQFYLRLVQLLGEVSANTVRSGSRR